MIPRPPGARAGGPAPWTARAGITLADVTAALERAGLALDARHEARGSAGSHAGRSAGQAPPQGGAPAAVLVALFEEAGEARVVLTRRSAGLRTHRGQVSFPGGRMDPGEGVVDAALREAHEEIALDPGLVRPLGLLPASVTVGSGVAVTPVLGVLASRPAVAASPAEVERVFDVALAELAFAFWEEEWTRPDVGTVAVYFFEVGGETVWGATARVLVELLALVLAR